MGDSDHNIFSNALTDKLITLLGVIVSDKTTSAIYQLISRCLCYTCQTFSITCLLLSRWFLFFKATLF